MCLYTLKTIGYIPRSFYLARNQNHSNCKIMKLVWKVRLEALFERIGKE